MTEKPEIASPNHDPGLAQSLTSAGREEFLDGAFGVNLKTLKSVWTLFKTPKDYFAAARTPNWGFKYTPSMQLMLGISAVMMFFYFFWGDPNSAFIGFSADMQPGENLGENPEFRELMSKMMRFSMLIATPMGIAIYAIFAWAFRAWGEKLPYIIRLRYIFAITIPAGIIGLFILFGGQFLSQSKYGMMSMLTLPLTPILYFDTARRGAYAHMETGEAIGRSIFLAGTLFVATVFNMFMAGIISAIRYIEEMEKFLA